MSATPAFVSAVATGVIQILPADTTTLKTVVTGGASGTKVTSLLLSSTDTADKVVQLWLTRSGVSYLLGTVAVPLSSGTTAAILSINAFSTTVIPGLPTDNDGQRYLLLKSADKLEVAVTVTLTAAKVINAVAVAADF